MDRKDERIRDRAYEIWDREGRQEGRDQEYWLQAERELSASSGGETAQSDETAPTLSTDGSTPGIADDLPAPAKTNKKANGASKPLAGKAPTRKRRGSQPLSQA
jgi:hypothetical protein